MKALLGMLLAVSFASMAVAGEHGYLEYNAAGQLIISGPFNAVIPAPDGMKPAGPAHSNPRFMGESLKVSRAGFFGADRFIMFEIETTDAGPGTLSYDSLPTINFAGRDFHTRARCMQISSEELQGDNVPILEFIERQGFRLVPAIYARQLLIHTEDGSGEAAILYAAQLDGCDDADEGFKAEFDREFEAFVASVRKANPEKD